MHSQLRAIWLPLALAGVNFFLWPAATGLLPLAVAEIGFNVVRMALMVWAGFLVTRRCDSGLASAAGAGAAILVADHIILKGGTFLLHEAIGPPPEQYSYLMAFGGVLVSFVMFSPIAALLGLCGGLYGRRRRLSHAM